MSDDPLPNLISAVDACVLSAKGSLDGVVMRLKGLQADMIRCDEELAEKRKLAATESDRLRADIQSLRNQKAKADRERAIAEGEVEKVKKQIAIFKEQYTSIVDRALAPPTRAA
jgi:hypothetical protein